MDIKKTLSKLRSLKLTSSSLEFVEILNDIEREEFNQLLVGCLPRHVILIFKCPLTKLVRSLGLTAQPRTSVFGEEESRTG